MSVTSALHLVAIMCFVVGSTGNSTEFDTYQISTVDITATPMNVPFDHYIDGEDDTTDGQSTTTETYKIYIIAPNAIGNNTDNSDTTVSTIGHTDSASPSTADVTTDDIQITDNLSLSTEAITTNNVEMTYSISPSTEEVSTGNVEITDTILPSTEGVTTANVEITDTISPSTEGVTTANVELTDTILPSTEAVATDSVDITATTAQSTTPESTTAQSTTPESTTPQSTTAQSTTPQSTTPQSTTTHSTTPQSTAEPTTSKPTSTVPPSTVNPVPTPPPDQPPKEVEPLNVNTSLTIQYDNCNPEQLDEIRQNFTKDFQEKFNGIYRNVTGFQNVTVKKLACGSIEVDYAIVFDRAKLVANNVSSKTLETEMQKSANQSIGENGVQIMGFNVTRDAVEKSLHEANISSAKVDDCQAVLCAQHYSCISSSLTCQSMCKNTSTCNGDHGVCIHAGDFLTCKCNRKGDHYFDGPRCERKVSIITDDQLTLVLIVTVGGSVVVLIIITVIFVICHCCGSRKPKNESTSQTKELLGPIEKMMSIQNEKPTMQESIFLTSLAHCESQSSLGYDNVDYQEPTIGTDQSRLKYEESEAEVARIAALFPKFEANLGAVDSVKFVFKKAAFPGNKSHLHM